MKNLTLRLDDFQYETLRSEAFHRRTTLSALIREAIDKRPEDSVCVCTDEPNLDCAVHYDTRVIDVPQKPDELAEDAIEDFIGHFSSRALAWLIYRAQETIDGRFEDGVFE